MMDNLGYLINDIREELIHARDKFPAPNPCLAALMEEVGELSQALLQQTEMVKKGLTFDGVNDLVQPIRKEAIQVAVMAIRIVLDGDPQFVYVGEDYRDH